MTVRVIIKRIVPEAKRSEAYPLIIKLRTMATTQKGYVCGETLVNADNLEEWIVISSWDNLDSWRDWRISPKRAEINDKLESLLGTEAECDAYFYGDNHLYLQREK